MATLDNQSNQNQAPVPSDRLTVIDRSGDSSAGWAVAVILLIAVIGFGAYYFLHYHNKPAPAQNSGANINVQLPGTNGSSRDYSGQDSTGGTNPQQ
jgi:hypothetical protein